MEKSAPVGFLFPPSTLIRGSCATPRCFSLFRCWESERGVPVSPPHHSLKPAAEPGELARGAWGAPWGPQPLLPALPRGAASGSLSSRAQARLSARGRLPSRTATGRDKEIRDPGPLGALPGQAGPRAQRRRALCPGHPAGARIPCAAPAQPPVPGTHARTHSPRSPPAGPSLSPAPLCSHCLRNGPTLGPKW